MFLDDRGYVVNLDLRSDSPFLDLLTRILEARKGGSGLRSRLMIEPFLSEDSVWCLIARRCVLS